MLRVIPQSLGGLAVTWTLSRILTVVSRYKNCLSFTSLCLDLPLPLSEGPLSHLNFTPSELPQGPKDFEGRVHILFIILSTSFSTQSSKQEMLKKSNKLIINKWDSGREKSYIPVIFREELTTAEKHPTKNICLEYRYSSISPSLPPFVTISDHG